VLSFDCNYSEARCCGKAVGAKPRAIGSATISRPYCTLGYRACPRRQLHYGPQYNIVVTPWHGSGSALTPDAVGTRQAFRAGCAMTITMTLSTILVIPIALVIPGPGGVTSGILARTSTGGMVVLVGVRFLLILSKRNMPGLAISTPYIGLYS
jgi:hypothetical protein